MLAILLMGSGYGMEFQSAQILNEEVEGMVLAVAQGEMGFDEIAAWIKQRLIKLPR